MDYVFMVYSHGCLYSGGCYSNGFLPYGEDEGAICDLFRQQAVYLYFCYENEGELSHSDNTYGDLPHNVRDIPFARIQRIFSKKNHDRGGR